MNSLTTGPVASLLDALFDEAARTDAPLRESFGRLTPDERAALLGGAKSDYKGFYGRVRENFLPVSRETGKLLYMLARARSARSIVEFGTSFGISTVHLAAAVRDNGGGRVISSEFEPAKVRRARSTLAQVGLGELVEIREGDALETLARDLPPSIDLVLLDGAKSLYLPILANLEARLAPGAVVLADNADDSPEYLARVRDPANGYLSVPFGDDVELSMKLAGGAR